MRTGQILSHKMLGLFAGFLNVVLAAAVLDPSVSYLYLILLSAAQFVMAFSGFGLSHRLAMLSKDEAGALRVWPWFALSYLFGVSIYVGIFWVADAPQPVEVLLFTSLLLLLLLFAEWMRAAIVRQVGFVIYNVVLLSAAVWIFAAGRFPQLIWIVPLFGVCVLLWVGRGFFKLSGTGTCPRAADLVRALRVASVNHFYSLVVLIFPLVGLHAEVLGVLLVFRFAIFYNWQNFFWLRFGHKSLTQEIDFSHRRQNRTFVLMNIIAFGGTVLAVGSALHLDLFRFVPSGVFDAQFGYLLLYFATLRVLSNLLFPYEVFLLYRARLRVDLLLLAGTVSTLIVLAIALNFLTNAFVILTLVEVIWLLWRLVSWTVIRASGVASEPVERAR